MSQREANMVWLKDLLGNLSSCQRQLEWTEDQDAIQVITETMLRDLECCRRLCDALHRRARVQQAV